MNKRFALLMVMLIAALVLSACSSESKDTGKDYMEAVLKGELGKAEALACESFDGTETLVTFFRDEVEPKSDTIDLQVDLGKTNNQNELRVTGSVDCARTATAPNCGDDNRYVFSEKRGTLIILHMEKEDGDWCVAAESEFEGTPLFTAVDEGDVDDADADDAGTDDADADDAGADDAGADDAGTDDADADDAGTDSGSN